MPAGVAGRQRVGGGESGARDHEPRPGEVVVRPEHLASDGGSGTQPQGGPGRSSKEAKMLEKEGGGPPDHPKLSSGSSPSRNEVTGQESRPG